MRPIDLRSDIVTHPTEEMRRAMCEADVGNDGAREDATTERLQELAAERLGKESALFVTSGTQGNLLAILSQVESGGLLITAEDCHVEYAESEGYRRIAGARLRSTKSVDGLPNPSAIRDALRETGGIASRLVWIENTHNMGAGRALPPDVVDDVGQVARDAGIRLHIDGSRIFNAATYLGVSAARLARPASTVQFCLSKGLAAPIGSILTGSKDTIERAREFRQMLGGQMRQVGVVAAAGIVAIEKMTLRLQEDHDAARVLADGLAQIDEIEIDPADVQTNLVYCYVKSEIATAPAVLTLLRDRGVLAGAGGLGPRSIRFVTHYEISIDDVKETLRVVERTLRKLTKEGSPT